MKETNPPREFSNARIVFDKMIECITESCERDITDLSSAFGEPIPRSSISQYVTKLTGDYFDGRRFYTRSVDGRLILGCHAKQAQMSVTANEILGAINS